MGNVFDSKKSRIKKVLENFLLSRIKSNKASISGWFASIEIGNLLASLSTSGMMAIGVIPMSLPFLIGIAILLFIIGVVGRYVDSVEDDMERLVKYEEHLNKGSTCAHADSRGSDAL